MHIRVVLTVYRKDSLVDHSHICPAYLRHVALLLVVDELNTFFAVNLVKAELQTNGGALPRCTVPDTTHRSPLVFSRCASAGDDGLVLVWNVEVNNDLQRCARPACDTLALIVHFPPSDRREAAGAAGPFPANNSHDHLHL